VTDAERIARIRSYVRTGSPPSMECRDLEWLLDRLAAVEKERDEARAEVATLKAARFSYAERLDQVAKNLGRMLQQSVERIAHLEAVVEAARAEVEQMKDGYNATIKEMAEGWNADRDRIDRLEGVVEVARDWAGYPPLDDALRALDEEGA